MSQMEACAKVLCMVDNEGGLGKKIGNEIKLLMSPESTEVEGFVEKLQVYADALVAYGGRTPVTSKMGNRMKTGLERFMAPSGGEQA